MKSTDTECCTRSPGKGSQSVFRNPCFSFFCMLSALALSATALRADSCLPFADVRIVDDARIYYVVVKRQGGRDQRSTWGPVELTIAQRKAGSAPVQPARAKVVMVEEAVACYQTIRDKEVNVRKGDLVLGRFSLDDPPGTILVSSHGLGVICLDLYGQNHTIASDKDPAVKIASVDGRLRHALQLKTLFTPKEIAGFHRTAGGNLLWLRCAWIDEKKGELVVVGRDSRGGGADPISVIELRAGRVSQGGREQVKSAISTMNPGALASALDLAISWNLKEVKPQLPAILANQDLPLEARLRAAVFLGSLGDKAGARLIAESAIMSSKELIRHLDSQDIEGEHLYDIYEYSVRHLPEFLGEKALPILDEVSRRQGYPPVAYDAYYQLGGKSLRHLIGILSENGDPNTLVFAAELIGRIKPEGSDTKAAVAALKKALRSHAHSRSGRTLRATAAAALGAIGAPAQSALSDLLELENDEDENVREAAAEAVRRIRRASSAK